MIEADTPTLWEISRSLGHPAAVAILVNALIHAAKLVSIERNLTRDQIGEAANDILQSYGYLKVEEVKFLLKRALRTEKIYSRLDYNIVMSWVEAYDAERTEEAMRISDHLATLEMNRPALPEPGARPYDEYRADLQVRADSGDPTATKILAAIAQTEAIPDAPADRDARHEKENRFKQWLYAKYLAHRKPSR